MVTMAASAPAQGGGNAFTRKIGPLPMWVWLAIVAAGVLIWAYTQRGKGASSSSSATQPPEVFQLSVPPEQDYDDNDDIKVGPIIRKGRRPEGENENSPKDRREDRREEARDDRRHPDRKTAVHHHNRKRHRAAA